MRSYIVLIAVAVLLIGSVFVVSHSHSQMKQLRVAQPSWEYKVVNIMQLVGGAQEMDEMTTSIEKHLNSLGSDGWELCQDMNGALVLKRKQ